MANCVSVVTEMLHLLSSPSLAIVNKHGLESWTTSRISGRLSLINPHSLGTMSDFGYIEFSLKFNLFN